MTELGMESIFVDTGAFYARVDEDDAQHQSAVSLFDDIRTGAVSYRTVFTSQFVLSELATLALYRLGHADAVRTLSAIRESASINVLPVTQSLFDAAFEQFQHYDDQQISFVDHTTGVLASQHDISHIFAFDDDFRTLGFRVVPRDLNQ